MNIVAQTPAKTKVVAAPSAGRPLGVTVISLLGMIGGVLLLLLGLLIALLGAAFGAIFGPLAPLLGGLIGGFLLVLGILYFIANMLLWKMKKSGMIIVMILSVIGLILSIITLLGDIVSGIIGIVINGVVLYYLYTKKNLFR